jgi:hypothetical protein
MNNLGIIYKKKLSRQPEFEELYESRKLPLKLGCYRRLILTTEKDALNGCYNVDLIEKRFQDRHPNLMIDVVNRINYVSNRKNILAQIAFNKKNCTILLRKRSLNFSFDINEYGFNLERIEIINCDNEEKVIENFNQTWLKSIWTANEFVYFNIQCVKTHESFSLKTNKFMIINSFEQFNTNYELSQDTFDEFTNYIYLNGSVDVRYCLMYSHHTIIESKGVLNLTVLESHAHEFRQNAGSNIQVNKQTLLNTTDLIELAGKIKSESMILSASVGQIVVKLGSSLASNEEIELKAKLQIIIDGKMQANKMRFDCEGKIEISKASCLEINTKAELLANENIVIDGKINCSAPSSMIQIGEIEKLSSLTLNGCIKSNSLDLIARRIKCNASTIEKNNVLNIVTSTFEDSAESVFYSKAIFGRSEDEFVLHGKFFGHQIFVDSKNCIMFSKSSFISSSDYISIISNDVQISGRLLTNIFQAISLSEVLTSKNSNLEFQSSFSLFAKKCNLNGNFKSTLDELKPSTFYVGFFRSPDSNSTYNIKTEILDLNASIISNIMVLDVVHEVRVKSESNINVNNLCINTSDYKDSCESVFNLNNLVFKINDSLIMNGKYQIQDTAIFSSANSIYMNHSLIIENSKKMIITANNEIYLAGRFGIECQLNIDAGNDIIIENNLEFSSIAESMLVRLKCKHFYLKNGGKLSSRSQNVQIEIEAESVQISNGSILTNFHSIFVKCRTFSILKSSINDVNMIILNADSYQDDFSANINANNLKITSESSLTILGKYSRNNSDKSKVNASSVAIISSNNEIVLNKNSLIEFDQISFLVINNLVINGTCTGHCAKFNSGDELVFGKDSSIICTQSIYAEAGSLKIDTIVIRCGEKFSCLVKGNLIFEANSQISANSIELKGKSLKNYGYLNATESISIILNRYYLNDFHCITKGEPFKKLFSERSITFESDKNSVRKMNFFSLKAKSINIICAFYVNLCGSLIESDILSIMALVILDLLTVNLAFRNTKNSLVSVNLSIDMPNIIEIVKSIFRFDTKRLREIFFKTVDYKQAISLFINAIKLIFPTAGAILSISWNVLLLIFNLPPILQKIQNLWKKGIKKIELCEVIPLIVGIKDLALQANSIYISSVSLKGNLNISINSEITNEESSGNKGPSFKVTDTFTKVGLMLASSFGSSISNDSLLSLNAINANIASNINTRSLFSFECNNLSVAQNIYEQFITSKQRSNQMFANTAIFEGGSMETSSNIHANQLQITLTDELNQLKNSVISVTDATIKCKDLLQKGTIDAKSSNIKVEGVHNVENTAKFKSHSGKYETGNTKVNGNLNLNRTEIVSKNITINENGIFVASNGELLLDSLLNCTGGMLDLKNMETNIVESYVSEINSKCQLTNSVVNANDIKIAGSHKMDNSVMRANKTIDITNESDLNVTNMAEFIATELNFDPQTQLKANSQLKLISKNLNMSKTSAIHGDDNSDVFLKAENLINIDSKEINVDHVTVDAKKLDDSVKFLNMEGKYENIKARESLTLKVEENIIIDKELSKSTVNRSLIADSILVNKEQSDLKGSLSLVATKGDVTVDASMNAYKNQINLISEAGNVKTNNNINAMDINVLAQDSFKNSAAINASNVAYFEAKTGVIDNIGGKLHGGNGLQAFAEKGINNIATEKNVRGAFDTIKKYTPAEITSDHGKVEIVVSDGKFVNDASKVQGNGNVSIYAKGGIESTPRTHDYCSYEHKSSSFFGFSSKHEKYYDTQVQKGAINSSDGKITLESENEIHCIATEFNSKEKVQIISDEGMVKLEDVVIDKRHESNSTSWFGLTSDNLKEKSSHSVKTTIASYDNVDIIARNGDVDLKNVSIKTPAKVEITGENVTVTGTVLNNQRIEERRDLSLAVFGHEIYNSQGINNIDNIQSSIDSNLQHVNNLFDSSSNNKVETGLNLMNTSIDVYNTAASISNNGLKSFISDTIGLPSSGKPLLSVGLTNTSSSQNYQTYGDGSIDAGELVVNAKNKATFEGNPVNVERDCEINAKVFTLKGVNLDYSYDFEMNKATLDASFSTGTVNLSISNSDNNQTGSKYLNQQFNVNGTLKLNVKDCILENANANVNSISGNVENLTVVSSTNENKASSHSFSLSTSGAIGFSKSNEESKRIGEVSALKVNESIDPNTFHIKNLDLVGGKVLSNNILDLKEIVSENITVKGVEEYSVRTSSGFSTNILNILPKAKHDDSGYTSQTVNVNDLNSLNDHTKLPQIKTFDLNIAKSNYKGVQDGVLHGKNGTLVNEDVLANTSLALTTNNESGHRVIKDETFDYKIRMPVKLTNDDHHDKKELEQLLNEKKEDIFLAHKFASLVYKNESDESKKEIPEGFKKAFTEFDDSDDTHSRIEVYSNENTKQVVISFKGTDSFKAATTSDIDIMTNKIPRSYSSDKMQAYLKEVISIYGNNDYQITFVGHSLGAAQASLASSQFKYNAICFDNPKLNMRNNENDSLSDFSRVINIQSPPNLINSITTNENNGINLQLNRTNEDFIRQNTLYLLASTVAPTSLQGLVNLTVLGYDNLNLHKLSKIGDRLEQQFE